MKRLLAIILVGTLMQTAGFAQNLKFGHINFQQLLSQMPERQEAQKQYEKEARSIQGELETMQVELNKKTENFQNQRDTLSEFVAQTRIEEIQQLQQRIQQYQSTARQRLRKKEQELMQPVYEKAQQAIKDVGSEEGFVYIFDTSSLLYFSPTRSQNVMPQVKQKLGISN